MPLLEVDGLRMGYRTDRGTLWAVGGTSFTLDAGQALGLVGESGSGKSSLALALMRLAPRNAVGPTGVVRIGGVDVLALGEEEFRRDYRGNVVAMAFQGAMNSLNPVMRVGRQIAEPLRDAGVAAREAEAKARALLEMVGLPPEVIGRYPHELSGGMKQRVVIAMALALDPKIVVLDEPTSSLDVSVQAQIMNLLKRLKRELGLALIFITHDLPLASDVCDDIGVVYGGRVVELGGIERALLQPAHPYTEKLLASAPRLRSGAQPEFIPGAPPDLLDLPPGCTFHPRCPHADDRCRTDDPPPFAVAAGHTARCWLRAGTDAP